MAILNEVIDKGNYIALIVISLSLISLLAFLGYCLIKEGSKLVGALVIIVAVGVISLAVIDISQGPCITYEALVTDYNVVHGQGYEVVGHRGGIVELAKTDEMCDYRR